MLSLRLMNPHRVMDEPHKGREELQFLPGEGRPGEEMFDRLVYA